MNSGQVSEEDSGQSAEDNQKISNYANESEICLTDVFSNNICWESCDIQ